MTGAKYDDFLRSLKLYNDGVLHRSELLSMVKPALSKLGNGNYFQAFKELLSGQAVEEPAAPKSPPPRVSKPSELTFELIGMKSIYRDSKDVTSFLLISTYF